ncbi:MAG: DUF4253 domain-containing protein [Alphaproteobacteria bacterium]|nr:DUF4253 domain-containing protein [Alphaproteobacteria bacterium]
MDFEIEAAGSRIGKFSSPFPFVRVPGREAHAALGSLQQAHQDATPVIWGAENQASLLFDLFDEPTQAKPVDSLTRAAKFASGWDALRKYRDEQREKTRAFFESQGWDYPQTEDEAEEPENIEVPPGTGPHDELLGFLDYGTGRPHAEVIIGIIPTARCWEVAAHLKYGAWNDCPAPYVHVALAREWHERYGARLVVNTGDILEFEVERPVQTLEEARELVPLFEDYCSDIIYQGVGSREALARTLHRGRFWYFWWD